MIEKLAFAKINLFLDVEGVRDDAYHNIISIMQSIDWADEVRIEITPIGEGIRLTCSDSDIPTDERNTAHKAARLFLERIGNGAGVSIHITKNIPHAAGLAGGSADAAAVLLGLNELFQFPLSTEELLVIGKKIGADVPFCIMGGTVLVTGIGEKLEKLAAFPPCYIVCAKMGEGVPTPQAYAELDRKFDKFRAYQPKGQNLSCVKTAMERGELSTLRSAVFNIFESVVEPERPSVTSLKRALLSCGATVAMMSGSGPSVFGIFEDLSAAEAANRQLLALGAISRVCRPTQGNI